MNLVCFRPLAPRPLAIIPPLRSAPRHERDRRWHCRDHPAGSHSFDNCPLDLEHGSISLREYYRYLSDFVADSRSRAASLIASPYRSFAPNTWELGFIRNSLAGRADATAEVVLTIQERCYLSHVLIRASHLLAGDAKVIFFATSLDECYYVLERTIPELPAIPTVEPVSAEDPEPRPRRR